MLVSQKINGIELITDTEKLHPSWLAHMLEFGVRQVINNHYCDLKGMDKYTNTRAFVNELMEGKERASGGSGSAKVDADPVTTLAVKNAKTFLLVTFKNASGKAKIADIARFPQAVPFFTIIKDITAWDDSAVLAWMIKRAAMPGGVDYMADARKDLAQSVNLAGLGL